ncbi:MAG: hypothetical protein OXE50_12865 [Chloroflexi bacterium]|nr:hypothetical protein [Chloroflexota bacterium]
MTPAYSESRALTARDRLTGFFGVGLLIMGAVVQSEVQLVVGAALVLYLIFTRHRRYDLYADALVIRYIGLRWSRIRLTDIQSLDVVELPVAGKRLLLRLNNRRRVLLAPQRIERFFEELRVRLPEGT